jgi:hypothetical protein
MDRYQLDNLFSYHAPRDEVDANKHQGVRRAAHNVAVIYFEGLPDCFEKEQAIRLLWEATLFANAALARERWPARTTPEEKV